MKNDEAPMSVVAWLATCLEISNLASCAGALAGLSVARRGEGLAFGGFSATAHARGTVDA
jgi:hypothetical protein